MSQLDNKNSSPESTEDSVQSTTEKSAQSTRASNNVLTSLRSIVDKFIQGTPVVAAAAGGLITGATPYHFGLIDRNSEVTKYFQQEIKESVDKLAGDDPDMVRTTFASLYALANDDVDKKRILISLALSRDDDELDEAIAYLVLSEDSQREKILENNISLRDAARRLESKWAQANYKSLESVETNADIRPQITNASTQLLSSSSSNSSSGWILFGRFGQTDTKALETLKTLENLKTYSSTRKIESEGINIGKYLEPNDLRGQKDPSVSSQEIERLVDSVVDVTSPIYIRQAPPSVDYELNTLANSPETSIIGVLCQGSEIEINEYRPIKPAIGNYTLWGRVTVRKTEPCDRSGIP